MQAAVKMDVSHVFNMESYNNWFFNYVHQRDYYHVYNITSTQSQDIDEDMESVHEGSNDVEMEYYLTEEKNETSVDMIDCSMEDSEDTLMEQDSAPAESVENVEMMENDDVDMEVEPRNM